MSRGTEEAAEGGDTYAMPAIAYMCQTGKGAEPGPEEAVVRYERSADRGCARAKRELAKNAGGSHRIEGGDGL